LALDSQNSRGYNFLLYRTTIAEGKKPRVVTYYQGHWFELLHDKPTGKPYLGDPGDNIDKYNGDSDPPYKSENKADRSDSTSEAESFTKKGKQ